MVQLYAYLLHLLTAFVLLLVFTFVYVKITPIDEFALIRRGVVAAALSLGGALVGFGLTLASAITRYDQYTVVFAWAISAMVIQLLTYAVVTRLLPQMNEALQNNNVAMGALMGSTSLTVGILNAACLS
ncbi:DUF350 domain-containing protein [Silvimonas amylolytica]|uniref:DUF350 domain-containing protein n=1 Tax=Silvimonas amylolytica TaxID=449663 RepID=A0ABQ2PJR9_9NEIS|nr:DUF350 domain-containing protein [Silvimonas amylolytica]GGP25598.1 DUF350 domain-containing protein [Silvimonas amylolytica]